QAHRCPHPIYLLIQSMLDYRRKLFLGVARIETVFVDTLGNPPRRGTGTGFWLRLSSGIECFVTNAHNLCPALKFPNQAGISLESAKLELRASHSTDGEERSYDFNTRFFEVDEKDAKIFVSGNSDCAIVLPAFTELTEGFSICAPFEEGDLADHDFFETNV